MTNISGAGQNIHIQQQIQQQHQVQQQQQQQQNPEVQEKVVQQETPRTYQDFSTRPSYMKSSVFKNDPLPGMNGRFGFGDIIFMPAQAGKAAGECGGLFMSVA